MFGKIDTVDAITSGVFTLASLATSGVYIGGKLQPGNIALSDKIWFSDGTTISPAFIISLSTLAIAYATNCLMMATVTYSRTTGESSAVAMMYRPSAKGVGVGGGGTQSGCS